MSKLDAATATILSEQIKRIHSAVNDGTLDRDTVNDALAKLTHLVEDNSKDSFTKFTGQDSSVSTRTPPVQTDAPLPAGERPTVTEPFPAPKPPHSQG